MLRAKKKISIGKFSQLNRQIFLKNDTDTDTDTDKFIYEYHLILYMPKITATNKLLRDNEIRNLLNKGLSTREIATKVGCSLGTINKVKNSDTDTKTDTDTETDTNIKIESPVILPHIEVPSSLGLFDNLSTRELQYFAFKLGIPQYSRLTDRELRIKFRRVFE